MLQQQTDALPDVIHAHAPPILAVLCHMRELDLEEIELFENRLDQLLGGFAGPGGQIRTFQRIVARDLLLLERVEIVTFPG